MKTVIFDLDGTLIDTEKYYRVNWPKAAAKFGYQMTDEQALSLRSLGRPYAQQCFKEWFGEDFDYVKVRAYRKELMEQSIQEFGMNLKPGALEIIHFLRERNITVAMATANKRSRTERYLKKIGLYDYFDKIVCADMVELGKPSADIYLYACKELGVEPKDCYAVEDSPNGATSAYRAGCKVIYIPDQTPMEDELSDKIYRCYDSLIDMKELFKTEIKKETLTGERALFHGADLLVRDCIFEDGESPLKESNHIELTECEFRWKYPLWYCNHIRAKDCKWLEMARAGVWYTHHISVENADISAPKNFRRCQDLTLKNVTFTDAKETLWQCDGVVLEDVSAKNGDYFAMNSSNLKISNLRLDGNYSFDGCKNVEIHDSVLLSKDAFWNSENITVYDSAITGEYLGWNAKNLTLINCTIESLQGMCYIENLVMKNCKLNNTTLAFEYCSVDAEITGAVDSVMNPKSGTIKADKIGTLIMQKDFVDPNKTKIICNEIEEVRDEPI